MKNYSIILIILFLALGLGSCTRLEDPIFEDNASARVQADVDLARSSLRSHADWWRIKYYPSSNREFGGYNIFAKFVSDSEVILTSDIDSDNTTSSYAVISETGALLTFNGFNKIIHYFTEPGIDSGKGAADSGLKGDFEFIVLESTTDSITLKGKKSGNIMVMEPIRGNGEEVVIQYRRSAAMVDAFNGYRMLLPSGKIESLTKSERTFRLTSNANSSIMSYRPTLEGFELYSPYEIENVSFKTLKYVQPDATYPEGHFTDESGSIKIFAPQTSNQMLFSQNRWHMTYSNLGATGKGRWDIARTKLQAAGFTLSNVYIGRVSATYPMGIAVGMNNMSAQGVASFTFTPIAGTTNQFRLPFVGAYALNNGFTGTHYNAGMTDIIAPFANTTFTISVNANERPLFITITDNANPNNFYRLTLTTAYNPYNK
ncbi:DUF4302 domain-containing protein [Sphingobacterium corticis]|uniref:DUF4302 domain-containing protein n=1 Tax=Sphingobacterium corticis TaxID=1812823 RepID=A0ABW5NJ33_9SPHI